MGANGFATLAFGYDDAGRLGTLTQATRFATLGYKPLAGTHQSTAITVSGAARYAATRTTDAIGRIGRIDTATGRHSPCPPRLHLRPGQSTHPGRP